MLACQLCVPDDMTYSKSKWVKEIIVWLCCPDYLSSLFCEDSDPWCFAATITMYAKWMYRNLTQGIRRLKTFTITKSGTADKKYHTHTHKHKDTHTHTHTHTQQKTKNKKKAISVEFWDHCV